MDVPLFDVRDPNELQARSLVTMRQSARAVDWPIAGHLANSNRWAGYINKFDRI